MFINIIHRLRKFALFPVHFNVVCGVDGENYGNRCLAENANVAVACRHACPCNGSLQKCPKINFRVGSKRNKPQDIQCGNLFRPVCGVDGETYKNLCNAVFEGVKPACIGECAPIPGTTTPNSRDGTASKKKKPLFEED